MTTSALRRRLDALEADLRGESDRSEFNSLVAELNAATAAAKDRASEGRRMILAGSSRSRP